MSNSGSYNKVATPAWQLFHRVTVSAHQCLRWIVQGQESDVDNIDDDGGKERGCQCWGRKMEVGASPSADSVTEATEYVQCHQDRMSSNILSGMVDWSGSGAQALGWSRGYWSAWRVSRVGGVGTSASVTQVERCALS